MRALLGALVLIPLLAACGGEETFTATGTIGIGSIQGGVFAADSAGAGDRCQGVDALSAFKGGGEVIVLDADGSKVAVGELEEGVLPDQIEEARELGFLACEFEFTVEGIPAGDGLFTLKVGDEEKTFKQSDAVDLDLNVTDD